MRTGYSSDLILIETFGLTYPQFMQARCGSFACPHWGHALTLTAFKAWCERRARLTDFDVRLAGNIAFILCVRPSGAR